MVWVHRFLIVVLLAALTNTLYELYLKESGVKMAVEAMGEALVNALDEHGHQARLEMAINEHTLEIQTLTQLAQTTHNQACLRAAHVAHETVFAVSCAQEEYLRNVDHLNGASAEIVRANLGLKHSNTEPDEQLAELTSAMHSLDSQGSAVHTAHAPALDEFHQLWMAMEHATEDSRNVCKQEAGIEVAALQHHSASTEIRGECAKHPELQLILTSTDHCIDPSHLLSESLTGSIRAASDKMEMNLTQWRPTLCAAEVSPFAAAYSVRTGHHVTLCKMTRRARTETAWVVDEKRRLPPP